MRELVQNAVDACRERHHVQRDETTDLASDLRVIVSIKNNDNGTYSLIVEDTGIGMSLDTLKNYFLNAGASFRSSLAWKTKFQGVDGKSEVLRSGRFGVGALAAFLVADDPTQIRLRVETRRVDEPADNGLVFETPLSDEPISIKHTTRQTSGTKIEVITNSPPAFMQTAKKDDKSQDNWDWYCLDWPVVQRKALDGQLLKQETTLPADPMRSPGQYHWIHPDDYEAISWTFDKSPQVVCNGLIVVRNAGYAGVPPLIKEATTFSELEVSMPRLSIFDKNGKLPLTLDRLRLDFGRLTFLEDLRGDVIRNIIAFLVVFAPEGNSSGEVARPTDRVTFSDGRLSNHTSPVRWMFRDGGVGLYDPALMRNAAITHVVELSNFSDVRFLKSRKLPSHAAIAVSDVSVFQKLAASTGRIMGGRQHAISADTRGWDAVEEDLYRRRYESEKYEIAPSRMWREPGTRSPSENRFWMDQIRAFVFRLASAIEPNRMQERGFWSRVGLRGKGNRVEQGIDAAVEQLTSRDDPRYALRLIYDQIIQNFDLGGRGQDFLGRIFEMQDRHLENNNQFNPSLFDIIWRIVELSQRSIPQLQKNDVGKFDLGSSYVDWGAITPQAGGDKWFLSEFLLEETTLSEEMTSIPTAWIQYLGEVFIPIEFIERKRKFAKLWASIEMKAHFAQWEEHRERLLAKTT